MFNHRPQPYQLIDLIFIIPFSAQDRTVVGSEIGRSVTGLRFVARHFHRGGDSPIGISLHNHLARCSLRVIQSFFDRIQRSRWHASLQNLVRDLWPIQC